MDSLSKDRPAGITIITILLFLYAAITIFANLYVLVTAQDLSNEKNDLFVSMLLKMSIWMSTWSIIFGLVFCLVIFFFFQGKRWAKILIGVMLGVGILHSIKGTIALDILSIIIFIIYLWIFIYLFFFKSTKEFFQSA